MQYGQKSTVRLAMLDDIEALLELPEIREVSTQSLRAEGRVPRLPDARCKC